MNDELYDTPPEDEADAVCEDDADTTGAGGYEVPPDEAIDTDTKKVPPQIASGDGTKASSLSAINTTPSADKSQSKKKQRHILGLESKVYTVAIKCYDEQLTRSWDDIQADIKQLDKTKYQIEAIKHYKDAVYDTNGPWTSALEKPHYHFILRCVNRKDRVRVKTLLNDLHIYFRPSIDDALWLNHGVETVGNFSGYSLYLTHETEAAINDGKELYDINEVATNLLLDELEQVRNGYIRLVDSTKKITSKDMAELDAAAYKLGTEFKDFDAWYDLLPYGVRSNAHIKTIRESYDRGAKSKVAEHKELLRCCIFIQGEANVGKTYNTLQALSGKKILTVEGGGTGKFDCLRCDTDAIVINDDVCPNLLIMSDNYICQAYRRSSNNPYWTGHYLIITSNLSFDEYLETMHIAKKHYSPMASRFFICEVAKQLDGKNHLMLKCSSTRGTATDIQAKKDMFDDFKIKFDASISDYQVTDQNDQNAIQQSVVTDGTGCTRFIKRYLMPDEYAALEKYRQEKNNVATS